MAATHSLRIEIRKKTFTNWCNNRLKGSGTEIGDLQTELNDATTLISLLKQLSGKEVGGTQDAKNLATAFDFMKNQERIPLYIEQEDIAECNLDHILGLVWILISTYQILGGREHVQEVAEKPYNPPSAKDLLLHWVQATMPEDLPVSNFTSDWKNGQLLSALVDMKKPGTIPNFRTLRPEVALANTKRAMDIAEAEFGIPKILDAEHICGDNLDERSLMAYLSYFCSGDGSPGYKNLLAWVRIKIPNFNIENFTKDWRDGRALSALVNTVAEGMLPNHASLDPSNGVENVRVAMEIAEEKLEEKKEAIIGVEELKKAVEGLARIMDSIRPEEFVDERACPLGVMCYIEGLRKLKLLAVSGHGYHRHNTKQNTTEKLIMIKNAGERTLREGFRMIGKMFSMTAWTAPIDKVLDELREADLITSAEGIRLRDISAVVHIQSEKSPNVMARTADILKRNGLNDDSNFLKVQAVVAELHVTTAEGERLNDVNDVIRIQRSQSPEVMVKTAKVLQKYGFKMESEMISVHAVLPDLQQTNLFTSEEMKDIHGFADVVRIQRSKTPEILVKTVEVLERYGFEKEFRDVLGSVLIDELQQAHLAAKEEEMLNDVCDVVRVQRVKSPALMARTADVLSRFGLEKKSQLLYVLAELGQADMITSDERERLNDHCDLVSIQCGKSPQVLSQTADVLSRFQGFEEESRFLAVLAELQRANLVTSEECKMLHGLDDVIRVLSGKSAAKYILKKHGLVDESKFISVISELGRSGLGTSAGCRILLDPTCLLEVLIRKPAEVVTRTEYILQRSGFKFRKEFRVLAVFFELQRAHLITIEECRWLSDINGLARVQSKKTLGIMNKSAEIMRKHGFKKEARFLSDDAFLSRRPTMKEVSDLVVPEVLFQWKLLGIQLGVTPDRLQEIEGFMREDNCCSTMFKEWLHDAPGTGSYQRSWEFILNVMEKEGFSAVPKIMEALRKTVAQPGDVEDDPEDTDMGEDLHIFEERYAVVVRNQATVTLKITKCTTIGPPRKGKTCLKHLLTGQKWDVKGGTVSTDVMEAPEWVECVGQEVGGAEDLWKLVSEEEQRGKVIRAVITIPTIDVTPPSPPLGTPPRDTPGEATPTATLDESLPTTTYDSTLSPPTPNGNQATTTLDENPATTTVGAPPTAIHDGALHSPTHHGSPPSVMPTNTSVSDLKTGTLMQGVQALASACSSEALNEFLKDRKGKVLGETQLIHFIDTGGQVIYHEIHPVLITTPSVYLVVFSLKDFSQMNGQKQLEYFRSAIIQHPLESICAFGMNSPQAKDHLQFHPKAPKIFIVGTHKDCIPAGDEQFLKDVDGMIEEEIRNKSYRQFVQYDTGGRSFWAVDNTLAGMEQEEEDKKYISTLRLNVQHESMEMCVKVPLSWMLLKVVMDGMEVRCCKYSKLLEEARKRGYVKEESPSEDLDTMLWLFHILSLFYHKVPSGCRKEDSLVFIDPDYLFSATSDFLMAAREEINEDLHQAQGATTEVRHGGDDVSEGEIQQQKLEPGGRIVKKSRVLQRMEDNDRSMRQNLEEVLQEVEETMAKLHQEPAEVVLELLRQRMIDLAKKYKLDPEESQDAATLEAKRQLFIGRQVHFLVSTAEAVLGDSERMGDLLHVREEVDKTVESIKARCQNRSIGRQHIDQILLILSDLRIVARLSDLDSYVVPAALPETTQSMEIPGSAAPVFITVVSQTVMKVCYLPSSLYCCLISELVTGLGWTVIPFGRTHVAFTHEGFTGRVHLIEQKSCIEVRLDSEESVQELTKTGQLRTVKEGIHESIGNVFTNVYSGSPEVLKRSLVWGFPCKIHPGDDSHIAAFRLAGRRFWGECLKTLEEQKVVRGQFEWFK